MKNNPVRTMTDIARLAGVSKSTVSRALNDSPLISEETKQQIRDIAQKHNFQMNLPASRLSKQRSNTLGFVTHGYAKDFCVDDLFSLEMLGAISAATSKINYDLLMLHVDPRDQSWPEKYLNTGRVDGFILMTSTRKSNHIKALLALQAPFIVWGIPDFQSSHCSVTGDNLTGGLLATRYLLKKGRRKIAFIGGPEEDAEVKLRFKGYQQALAEAGMEVDPNYVVYGDYSSPSGAIGCKRLLQQAPDMDAIFANSDMMATGALNYLNENCCRVPDQIAVMGYDDVSITAHTFPPLTTIRQNIPESGRLLVRNLIQYLETGIISNATVPVELVIRGSA
jgi:DNA-binding LacI/PurR family transcriptional regulator